MKLFKIFLKSINLKMGAIGGLLMGAVAFYVNRNAGFEAAMIPALKQFFYGLLVGGVLVRITERISVSFDKRALSLFLGCITPCVITTVLIASIHLFKGTPNPYETILYTTLPTPIGFFIVAYLNRRRYDKRNAQDAEAVD